MLKFLKFWKIYDKCFLFKKTECNRIRHIFKLTDLIVTVTLFIFAAGILFLHFLQLIVRTSHVQLEDTAHHREDNKKPEYRNIWGYFSFIY